MSYITDNFDRIYKILSESFPEEELRTYDRQKSLLSLENYNISVSKTEEDIITGVLCFWDLGEFVFIDHLAVDKEYRNKGKGSALLEGFLLCCDKPVILETEPPVSDINRRRISFYENQGFFLTDFAYSQPPMRKDTGSVKLNLMSYPTPIDENDFENVRKKLYESVYGINK